jgi:hypothetical protein
LKIRTRSSLCCAPSAPSAPRSYLAPLLYALSEHANPARAGRALVLMPLKALAQDQARARRRRR